MEFQALEIAGCYLIHGNQYKDDRGSFLKLLHAPTLKARGLEDSFVESYLTTSKKGVIRGMHFQIPPADHAKLVYCLVGQVRDGLVDLRRHSPTYRQSISLLLSSEINQWVYIPKGVAHGFATHSEQAQLLYMVSSVHEPKLDTGIRWDSVQIDWWAGSDYTETPVVSERDRLFESLQDFNTPFTIES